MKCTHEVCSVFDPQRWDGCLRPGVSCDVDVRLTSVLHDWLSEKNTSRRESARADGGGSWGGMQRTSTNMHVLYLRVRLNVGQEAGIGLQKVPSCTSVGWATLLRQPVGRTTANPNYVLVIVLGLLIRINRSLAIRCVTTAPLPVRHCTIPEVRSWRVLFNC
jgi:hypothetical protein